MRFIGIDYGTKRVGVALSDASGDFAYPHVVLRNSPELVGKIAEICSREEVKGIVIGESKDYAGTENAIMPAVRVFGAAIAEATSLPVYFEPELLTSAEATRIQGKNEHLDAAAAALILRSYLGRKKGTYL